MNYYKEQKRSSVFLRSIIFATTLMISSAGFAAETNTQNDINDVTMTQDPYEGFNRVMFRFNDTIDTYALKPVAKLYNAVMPRPLNQGVHNFFNNLSNIPTIANDILQLNLYQATRDTWRLAVNSTIGIGGLFDVATRINLPQYSNDFGMTLAYWGYKNSNFLVLPFFGPTTIRDGVGLPVDYFVFSVYPYVQPDSTRYQLYGLGVIDRRAQLLKFENVMQEAALDKYIFLRDAYLQRRAYQLEQNQHVGFVDRVNSSVLTDQADNVPAGAPGRPVPKALAPAGA